MEPFIGNERLALSDYLKSAPDVVHAGPDVWTPTKNLWPWIFSEDGIHPNRLGAEVMAQKWVETLLEHDGLPVPDWSRKEMEAALTVESFASNR